MDVRLRPPPQTLKTSTEDNVLRVPRIGALRLGRKGRRVPEVVRILHILRGKSVRYHTPSTPNIRVRFFHGRKEYRQLIRFRTAQDQIVPTPPFSAS